MNILQKKYNEDKNTILSIIKYVLITTIVLAVLFFGGKLLWLLLPVLIGFAIAYTSTIISKGIYRLFRRKSPTLTAEGQDTKGYKLLKLIIYFVIFLTFIGFLILIIFILIAQIKNLISFIEKNAGSYDIADQLSQFLLNWSARLGDVLPQSVIENITTGLSDIQSTIIKQTPELTGKVLAGLVAFAGNSPNIVFKIIVIVMSGYYFISDRVTITKFIDSVLPSKKFVTIVMGTAKKVTSSLFRLIGGYLIIMVVTFFEALIGLIIIRMPYAVVIAVVVMFIDLLPMVGASACFVPISIYMFIQGQIWQGVVALVIVVIMTFVRSALQPKVIGDAIKLHPLATLASMLLGMAAFGVVGIIVGPIAIIFLIGIADAFGLHILFKNWSSKILNKVAGSDCDEDPDSNIIRHIVMWKIKEDDESKKNELIQEICDRLLELPNMIPEIVSLQCKTNLEADKTAFDLVLIVDFKDKEALKIYTNHPEHTKVAKLIKQSTSERSAMDICL